MPVTLPDPPFRIAGLPKDERGYPVPRFVEWIDGKPDFRYASAEFRARAFKVGLCWVCGDRLGNNKIYAIGPMCVVNRVTQEPACHRVCAEYAVKACPFMLRPRMKRIPLKEHEPRHSVGTMIERNPGVICLYETKEAKPFKANGGWLIKLGKPTRVDWWAEGRQATREEVMESINSGYPLLMGEAMKESVEAVDELTRLKFAALKLVPA